MAGETFLQVLPICQGKAPGGKKRGTSELTSCQFLCILCSVLCLGSGPGGDESQCFHEPMAAHPLYTMRRKGKLLSKQFISPASVSVTHGDNLGISFCLCLLVWPRPSCEHNTLLFFIHANNLEPCLCHPGNDMTDMTAELRYHD